MLYYNEKKNQLVEFDPETKEITVLEPENESVPPPVTKKPKTSRRCGNCDKPGHTARTCESDLKPTLDADDDFGPFKDDDEEDE